MAEPITNQMPDSNTQHQGEDPYNFLLYHSHISASQEQYLRDLSVGARSHHSPSPSRADSVQPTAATECDDPCTVNYAVDVDAATQGLMLTTNQMPDSNTQHQGEDPYNFLLDHSHISASQEPYLRDLSVGARSHHSPSRSRASADSVPLDVFHTPPENTSLPSFCDQPTAATECDDPCTVNYAVDVDAATQGFVHFSEGSDFADLGFSEVQLSQEMSVDECLVKKPKLSEVQSPNVQEGVGNCEGKLISEAENLETLVGKVGLCESEKAACTVEGSKSSDGVVKDSGMGKKRNEARGVRVLPASLRGPLKIAASESECLKNAASESEFSKNAASGVECGKSLEIKNVFDVLRVLLEISDGVVQDSEMGKKSDEERLVRELPPSVRGPSKIAASESEGSKNAASKSECWKNAARGVEFGNIQHVNDVYRALLNSRNEKEKNLDYLSLLDVAEACGMNFPRPRWWPPVGEDFDP